MAESERGLAKLMLHLVPTKWSQVVVSFLAIVCDHANKGSDDMHATETDRPFTHTPLPTSAEGWCTQSLQTQTGRSSLQHHWEGDKEIINQS